MMKMRLEIDRLEAAWGGARCSTRRKDPTTTGLMRPADTRKRPANNEPTPETCCG